MLFLSLFGDTERLSHVPKVSVSGKNGIWSPNSDSPKLMAQPRPSAKAFPGVTVGVYPVSSELPDLCLDFVMVPITLRVRQEGCHTVPGTVKALRALALPECPPGADLSRNQGFYTHSLVPGPRSVFEHRRESDLEPESELGLSRSRGVVDTW